MAVGYWRQPCLSESKVNFLHTDLAEGWSRWQSNQGNLIYRSRRIIVVGLATDLSFHFLCSFLLKKSISRLTSPKGVTGNSTDTAEYGKGPSIPKFSGFYILVMINLLRRFSTDIFNHSYVYMHELISRRNYVYIHITHIWHTHISIYFLLLAKIFFPLLIILFIAGEPQILLPSSTTNKHISSNSPWFEHIYLLRISVAT